MATGYTTTCRSLLNKDILYDCSKLDAKGFAVEGVIVNRADIDYASFTSVSAGSPDVDNFPLKTGAEGYRIQQPANDPFTGTQVEVNVGTYFSTFNKTVSFIMFTQETDDLTADALANGEFVVILRKKKIATNANPAEYEYPIFGLDCGLKVTEMTKDYYSDDTHGAWLVTMVEEGAPTAERRLFSTTPGGQETILASLVTHTP